MDKLQVTEFDGHRDFEVWKVQVQPYLIANGWFGTIDGSIPQRPGVDGEISKEWTKIDAKAKALLLNCLETKVVRTVMAVPTASQIWRRLSTMYESRCRISVSLLLKEFHSYKMTDDMDMNTHIANVESMIQRLGDVGQKIDTPQTVSKLLELPRKYRHLVSAWDMLDEEKRTVENLIPRLMKAEKIEQGDEKPTGNETVAFVSKTKKTKKIQRKQARSEEI
ncbi:uncharacterized protein LOC108865069 [Galendromus occidentalis]|uniref:Uncharacterized protein LOC108865069 n=1 Tax=Galendromus occidentalis TaxID=34638 RepID=A0AAJ7PAZ8_9ACAR|nr:uncharacterized protein LOC108865069 [Galendromus occidentalis]